MRTLADELFREFREHSVSEFFRKNAAMLGYTGKIRSLTTVVHEGVTNSIDACEEAGILPEVKVWIKRVNEEPDHFHVIIEDNGPGIPEEFIPDVFGKMLAGTKLHRNQQQRGQQGIGVSGATMFAQMTTGKPTEVITSTGNGEIVRAEVMIDVNKNVGQVIRKTKMRGKWRGTKVRFDVKDVSYIRSRYGPFNYLRLTAIANPHVRIIFEEPDGTLTVFERGSEEIPDRPKPMPLHPAGVMADDLLVLAKLTKSKTVGNFLVSELSRMTKERVSEVERISGVNMRKKPSELTWEDAEKVVRAFRKMKFMAPSTSGLRPIGKENIEKGIHQILSPEFVAVVSRPPKVYRGGIPFAVESAIAYGGGAGRAVGRSEEGEIGEVETEGMELMRFANRVPLVFDQGGCAITAAVKSIDWRRYGVDVTTAPMTVMVNIVSSYVPYTSAGKQSVAAEPEIYEEVRNAVMDVARELRYHLHRKQRQKEREERAGIFEKYLPIIATKAAGLAGVDPPSFERVLMKVMGMEDVEA